MIGKKFEGYKIKEFIGNGAIGTVYKAYNDEIMDYRAIKFVEYDENTFKKGWENEIRKANQLRNDNVVRYHSQKTEYIDGTQYMLFMWDYVEGESLKTLIERNELTVNLLIEVIRTCLKVLFSCDSIHIIHGDLHAGNILIENINPQNVDSTVRKVLVTDFGYLTQYSCREYMDDYDGLNVILHEGLRSINYNGQNSENKKKYNFLKNEFPRYITERNATVGFYVRKPKKILQILNDMLVNIDKEKSPTSFGIGDYLAAEHLGEYYDVWKALFVPKFIAIDDLITRNISVLTGLRGCGKTMVFKRLSAFLNCKLGKVPIPKSDSFVGFYFNARNIPEAFPWLPKDMIGDAREQIINHFNLSWTLEILLWLQEISKNKEYDFTFLKDFFQVYFPSFYSVGENSEHLIYLVDLINKEIISSRLESKYGTGNWRLSDYDFLENFVKLIKTHISEIDEKPFYLFLDDYSMPMVRENLQLVLNPIIFRRSADVIFKISTESAESFVPLGLNGKPLEENSDYQLIDCGTMLLTKSRNYIKDILSALLQPRIERHEQLKGRNISLEMLLGFSVNDNERLAILTKNNIGSSNYQGYRIFCDVWSSDIREMVNIFADMINREEIKNLKKEPHLKKGLISDKNQHKSYMELGGQFMSLLGAATNPEERNDDVDHEHKYARHLKEIVEAFHDIALDDMKNKISKNEGKITTKKARRIEIKDIKDALPKDVNCYYKGLIRYGIFVRDNRGKSINSKIVPRLVLRGVLIPYFKITFSKRDNITMSWEQFIEFLRHPKTFAETWIRETEVKKKGLHGQIDLWDNNSGDDETEK
jgi:serine/threonine protein kinase